MAINVNFSQIPDAILISWSDQRARSVLDDYGRSAPGKASRQQRTIVNFSIDKAAFFQEKDRPRAKKVRLPTIFASAREASYFRLPSVQGCEGMQHHNFNVRRLV